MIVVAISSEIDWSAFATICSVTDRPSRRAASATCASPAGARGFPSRVAPYRPAVRDDDVVSYSSTRHGPAAAPSPIEARDAHRHIGRLRSEPHRSLCKPLGTSASSTSKEGVAGRGAECREADGTYVRPASRAGRARRRACSCSSSNRAPQADERAPVDGPVRQRLPPSPSSARRSEGRRCGATSARRDPRTPARAPPPSRRTARPRRRRVGGVDVELARSGPRGTRGGRTAGRRR